MRALGRIKLTAVSRFIAVELLIMAALEPDVDGPPVEDNEPHSDDDTDDLTKPTWVGYFRLPREDVEMGDPFLPKG